MTALRHLARSWRYLTLLATIAALAVRLMVPAGFMPDAAGNRFAMVICTGLGPMKTLVATPPDGHGSPDSGDRADQPCGFGGMQFLALPTIDPVIVLAAIAFVMLVVSGFVGTRPARLPSRLRPPLRAPPRTAAA